MIYFTTNEWKNTFGLSYINSTYINVEVILTYKKVNYECHIII